MRLLHPGVRDDDRGAAACIVGNNGDVASLIDSDTFGTLRKNACGGADVSAVRELDGVRCTEIEDTDNVQINRIGSLACGLDIQSVNVRREEQGLGNAHINLVICLNRASDIGRRKVQPNGYGI